MNTTPKETYNHIYVDGGWVSPVAQEMADLVHPASGRVTGQAVRGGIEDVDSAVTAARVAFPAFARTAVEQRITYLKAFRAELEKRQKAALENLKVGPPDSDAFVGPVVSEKQWSTVERYIQRGIDEGAKVVAGGVGKPEGLEDGFYVKPTIFADVTNDMTIAREEIFGPVASVITYETVEEAIEITNDSPYGLSGYVFGADHDRAVDVARQLRTGNVHVNSLDHDVQAPWGGYKTSGIGREAGEWGIDDMLEVKAITNYFPLAESDSDWSLAMKP